jgi:hypothetical protein
MNRVQQPGQMRVSDQSLSLPADDGQRRFDLSPGTETLELLPDERKAQRTVRRADVNAVF